MKKILFIFTTLVIFLSFTVVVSAQTPTAKSTVEPTISEKLNEKLNTQINKLKDKIASRVSELNLVEKKGVTGVVSEITTNKITLNDISGNTKLIDIDEITKFSSSSAKGTFGLSDLTKGTKVNVLGLYNKQSKRILARFITTAVNPSFPSGTISEIDSKNFIITVITKDLKSAKIDIGTSTKITTYSKEDGLTKIGFAKLEVGNRVTVVGFPDKTDPSLIIASRVVVLPEAPKDPKVSITPPTPTPTPSVVLRRVTQIPVATSGARRVTPTVSR